EDKGQWIDSKTGEGLTPSVWESGPAGEKRLNKACIEDCAWCRLARLHKGWERDPADHRRAFNPETGQNGHWDEDKGQWIDSKTGEGLTPSVWESGPAGE
ncbi:MAG: hypothetical protein IVW53_10180, partial [Chloroflexi bacterium]|nr:hypothetical protein [Chloroflexota bacterium]